MSVTAVSVRDENLNGIIDPTNKPAICNGSRTLTSIISFQIAKARKSDTAVNIARYMLEPSLIDLDYLVAVLRIWVVSIASTNPHIEEIPDAVSTIDQKQLKVTNIGIILKNPVANNAIP